MKFVPFAQHGLFESRGFLLEILGTAPGGQTIKQMRERLGVFKAIESAGPEGVTLEDAQHTLLQNVIESMNTFVPTSEHIIAIADSVAQAKAPPEPEKATAAA